eukprot:TRINITY_DN1465_c0_g1_i1.p1 TRINITY_DN1465_c0_g1~~TRINITY_DN1465_c0_g1_i1.p1  ORF type:complete len:837 (-),score=169.36 TRINITY_DN1465_c0_g1_i1:185-2695(-)
MSEFKRSRSASSLVRNVTPKVSPVKSAELLTPSREKTNKRSISSSTGKKLKRVAKTPKKQDSNIQKHYYRFDMWLRSAIDLPVSLNGHSVICEWRRGTKKKSGRTKNTVVNERLAVWEEKVVFYSPMLFKVDTYNSKRMTLKIIGEENSLIAKCELDLKEYITQVGGNEISSNFLLPTSNSAKIKFRMSTSLVRVNQYIIKGPSSDTSLKGDDTTLMKIGGISFFVTESTDPEEKSEQSSASDDEKNFSDTSGVLTKSAESTSKDKISPPLSPTSTQTKSRDASNPASLIQELEFYDKKIQKLEQQNKTLKSRIEFIDSEKDRANAPPQIITTTTTTVDQSVAQAVDEEKYKDLMMQLEDSKERYSMLTDQNDFLRKNVQLLEDQVKELNKTCESLNENLKKYKTEVASKPGDNVITVNLSDPLDLMRLKVKLALLEQKSNNDSDSPSSPDTTPNGSQVEMSPMTKSLSKSTNADNLPQTPEIVIMQTISRLVYHSLCVVNTEEGVPTSAVNLFDWLCRENVFIAPRPRVYSSLFSAIKNYAVKVESVSSLETTIYWLSTLCHLKSFMEKKSDSVLVHVRQLFTDADLLIYDLYNHLVRSFVETITPHIADIFCVTKDEEADSNFLSSPSSKMSSSSSSTKKLTSPKRKILSFKLLSITWDIDVLIAYISDIISYCKQYVLPSPLLTTFTNSLMRAINYTLFNTLCSRRELCTSGNGFKIKLLMSRLDDWCRSNKEFASEASSYLKLVTEAATVLSLDKNVLEDDSIIGIVCPTLNFNQLKHLLVNFTTDNISPQPVPLRVVDKINAKAQVEGAHIWEPEEVVDLDHPLDLSYLSS